MLGSLSSLSLDERLSIAVALGLNSLPRLISWGILALLLLSIGRYSDYLPFNYTCSWKIVDHDRVSYSYSLLWLVS